MIFGFEENYKWLNEPCYILMNMSYNCWNDNDDDIRAFFYFASKVL